MKINKKIFILLLSFFLLPFNYLNIFANQYGDINNDGCITAYDASCVIQNVLKNFEFTPEQENAAKVTGNFNITFQDAAEILKKALDNSYVFPVETLTEVTTETSTETSTEATTEPPFEDKGYKIESVKSSRDSKVILLLNKPTVKPLEAKDFSIICADGGSSMTILGVSTKDNMLYEISTAQYKDNKYNLRVNFADGTYSEKDFEVKIDCPYISSVETIRKSDISATLSYVSDEPGSFYYFLEKNSAVKLSSEITAEEIIQCNNKSDMLVGPNEININGLEKGCSYTLHYVAKNPEGKTTIPDSINISSEIKIEEENDFKIVNVKSYDRYFDIQLNKPTKTVLTGSNFKITCPANGVLHTEEASKTDNINYRLYMNQYYIYKDNNTMTLEITLEDDSIITGKFYADYSAPVVQNKEISRTGENTAELIIKVNEAGKLYYIIKDEVGDSIVAKDPNEIFNSPDKKIVDINWGANNIPIENVTTGKYICFVTEDKNGNRLDYYESIQIPEYDPSLIPEKKLAIEKVTVFKDSYFGQVIKVQFNDSMSDKYISTGSDIQLSGPNITGRLSYSKYGGNLLKNEYAFIAETAPYKPVELISGEKYNLSINIEIYDPETYETLDYQQVFYTFIAE